MPWLTLFIMCVVGAWAQVGVEWTGWHLQWSWVFDAGPLVVCTLVLVATLCFAAGRESNER